MGDSADKSGIGLNEVQHSSKYKCIRTSINGSVCLNKDMATTYTQNLDSLINVLRTSDASQDASLKSFYQQEKERVQHGMNYLLNLNHSVHDTEKCYSFDIPFLKKKRESWKAEHDRGKKQQEDPELAENLNLQVSVLKHDTALALTNPENIIVCASDMPTAAYVANQTAFRAIETASRMGIDLKNVWSVVEKRLP